MCTTLAVILGKELFLSRLEGCLLVKQASKLCFDICWRMAAVSLLEGRIASVDSRKAALPITTPPNQARGALQQACFTALYNWHFER
jgi:hypothetical protein